MQIVSTEEIINYKILPYNIYSEFGEKLFSAGEVLTPGKLLQLRHMSVLYRDDENQPSAAETAVSNQVSSASPIQKTTKATASEPPKNGQNVVIESFDMNIESKPVKNIMRVDDVDIMSYKGPINKKAKIDPQTQIKIKAFYNIILEMMDKKNPSDMLDMFMNVRDKIVHDIILEAHDVSLCSQLKLLGEYNKCHALNTAILGGAVAKKLNMNEGIIYDIVLAGLLHDIGKTRLPQDLLNKTNLSSQEQKQLQTHTKIGYRILKTDMDLPENIAKVALDHHECNDGTGYPSGKSGEWINTESQIINVCNHFDNITSNRTAYKVKNIKEALRVMLGLGTKKFSAEVLYTFVHMFNYNDTTSFEEMVL